ncbi:MAG: hypothetical protein HC846_07745 [Blastocatellia bacterium]|nr:hypothetical protein [Blastocatellia bacterium]
MNTSILNFTIVNSPKTKFSDAQFLLQEFTGKKFSRNEAENVWSAVLNHKWNMSENLGRDVGFRVAAIDFIENFYQSNKEIKQRKDLSKGEIKIPQFLRKIVRFYFESKGNSTNY